MISKRLAKIFLQGNNNSKTMVVVVTHGGYQQRTQSCIKSSKEQQLALQRQVPPPHPEHVSVSDLVSTNMLAFTKCKYVICVFCFSAYGPRKFTEARGLHNRGRSSGLIGPLEHLYCSPLNGRPFCVVWRAHGHARTDSLYVRILSINNYSTLSFIERLLTKCFHFPFHFTIIVPGNS